MELTKRILAYGKFNLRGWDINNLQLQQLMNPENSLNNRLNTHTDEPIYTQSEFGCSTPKYWKVVAYDFTSIAGFPLK